MPDVCSKHETWQACLPVIFDSTHEHLFPWELITNDHIATECHQRQTVRLTSPVCTELLPPHHQCCELCDNTSWPPAVVLASHSTLLEPPPYESHWACNAPSVSVITSCADDSTFWFTDYIKNKSRRSATQGSWSATQRCIITWITKLRICINWIPEIALTSHSYAIPMLATDLNYKRKNGYLSLSSPLQMTRSQFYDYVSGYGEACNMKRQMVTFVCTLDGISPNYWKTTTK